MIMVFNENLMLWRFGISVVTVLLRAPWELLKKQGWKFRVPQLVP